MKKIVTIFIIPVVLLFVSANKKQDPATASAIKRMKEVARQYQLTEPNRDSLFSIEHSGDEWFTKEFFRDGNFPGGAEQKFHNAKLRDVVGPFADGNQVKVYKILERRELPDSCEVRIIWVAHKGGRATDPKITRSMTESKLRADSIVDVINSGKSRMEDIVEKLTDDPGSKHGNNGNYGWLFPQCGIVHEIVYAGMTLPLHKAAVINTVFGYYVVQVLHQSSSTHTYTVVSVISQKIKQQ